MAASTFIRCWPEAMAEVAAGHDALMDRQYRWQRHIYDVSRKYYLLGRDRLILALSLHPGGSVLELGCGTGRNLALVARYYPTARLYGVDISAEMLKNARRNAPTAKLAQANATRLDTDAVFGEQRFDRIFMSYTLSMIPEWQAALDQAARLLAPGGRLHIVDFGQQERLPRWFGRLLAAWLAHYHVTPRRELFAACGAIADRYSLSHIPSILYRGYAWGVVLERGNNYSQDSSIDADDYSCRNIDGGSSSSAALRMSRSIRSMICSLWFSTSKGLSSA